ncbi:glycosyltransferase family 4 protein [Sporolactobacillus sp. THM19-2]|uniref:glycosyltransferase family 4 protein n=1 Tax=Sporolactobacillus sp. THM19-2 TaxID=2511171 RepID=UPI00101F4B93|nr:glycosyltransferase family 4 protein [Sporolactobacillus sp. THM19-2]RYL93265.1 glycosyltransferase family 1 protein [Sporolactobacillus sp. THM19-2]
MKIAMIATEKLPVPAIRGGAIQIYLQSSAEIIAKNHEVTMISIQDPDLPDEETINGIHYVRFPASNYLNALVDLVKESSFDIIHLCNRPAWVAQVKQAAPVSKIVLSVHNEMFSKGKLTQEQGKQCISDVSAVVTVSDFIRKSITDRFPEAEEKAITVYSGVDLDAYHPAWTEEGRKIRENMRKRAGLEGRKIILFVGRLSKVKGPHILLQAIPEITKRHPDAMLVFVGSKWFGDDQVNNYVRHLYTLGAMHIDHVTFIKFVTPRDIPGFYTMSDIFVCCSQWQEPLARVHYEAMAAGLPIITTDRGGNAEVIRDGENGRVITHFSDPLQYATRINELLDEDERRKSIGEQGRRIAEERFGWETVAGNLVRVYEGV